jgi:Na+/melibiose symporter-like transporter
MRILEWIFILSVIALPLFQKSIGGDAFIDIWCILAIIFILWAVATIQERDSGREHINELETQICQVHDFMNKYPDSDIREMDCFGRFSFTNVSEDSSVL